MRSLIRGTFGETVFLLVVWVCTTVCFPKRNFQSQLLNPLISAEGSGRRICVRGKPQAKTRHYLKNKLKQKGLGV
jgi:hypothetical protein